VEVCRRRKIAGNNVDPDTRRVKGGGGGGPSWVTLFFAKHAENSGHKKREELSLTFLGKRKIRQHNREEGKVA